MNQDGVCEAFPPPLTATREFNMARIKTETLESMCYRVAIGLNSGVDFRTIWQREAERGSSSHRQRMSEVFRAVEQGETLADAMDLQGNYFPALTVEMVQVGEQSGRLGDVFEHLADHYASLRQLYRGFLAMIWWPAFELIGSILIIALLITILGFIGEATNKEPIDVFGMGFSWQGNLTLFLGGVFFLFGTAFILIWGLLRGWFGSAPVALAMRVPVLGTSLKLLALSRFAWSFGMAIEAGMNALRSTQLGLASTQNPMFMGFEEQILASLEQGQQFYEAMWKTGVFPQDFLDVLETAEMSGTVTESLNRLSKEYQERASAAFRTLSVIGGILVMMMVGAMIVTCVIALAMKFYIGPIYDALDGNF